MSTTRAVTTTGSRQPGASASVFVTQLVGPRYVREVEVHVGDGWARLSIADALTLGLMLITAAAGGLADVREGEDAA